MMRHLLCLALIVAWLPSARAASILEKEPVFVETVDLEGAERYPYCAAADRQRGYAYFITNNNPAIVVKFRFATDSSPFQRVGSVTLEAGESFAYGDAAVVDEVNGYLYILLSSSPIRLVKIRVGDGDDPPVRVGAVDGELTETSAGGLAIDPMGGFLYGSVSTDPGYVVKFAAGDGDAAPTRIGALTMPSGGAYLHTMAIDPARGKGWIAGADNPRQIHQVSLGTGSALPAFDSSADFPAVMQGSSCLRSRYDPLQQTLYFHSDEPSGTDFQVAKYDVSGTAPKFVGTTIQTAAFEGTQDFDFDFQTGIAFVANDVSAASLVKVALGSSRFAGPGIVSVTPIPPGNSIYIETVVYDPINRFVYLGDDELIPARIYVFRQPAGDGPGLATQFLKAAQKGSPGKVSVRGQISIGNGSSLDTGLFFVRFFLSDDPVLSADDAQLGKDRLIKNLKAGKTRKVPFAGTKLPASAAGKYVIAVVDPQGIIESANPALQRVTSPQLQ